MIKTTASRINSTEAIMEPTTKVASRMPITMAGPSSPNGSIREGCDGLWATGDTSWEFGPQRDFSNFWNLKHVSKNSCRSLSEPRSKASECGRLRGLTWKR